MSRLPPFFSKNIVFILILFLSFQFPVWGASARSLFDQGLKIFKAGDYAKAAQYFEQARGQGLDDARLYYNLGVTYYKLERYQEAENAFVKVTNNKDMAPLAYYNLGLVALKEENKQQADHWFRKVLSTSHTRKITRLATDQLRILGYNVASQKRSVLPGVILLSGGVGYDDNVTLQPDDLLSSASGQEDMYFEFFGYGNKQIAGFGNKTLRIEGNLYSTRYDDLSAYDLDDAGFSLVLSNELEKWTIDSGLMVGATYIDGNGLNRTTTISVEGKRDLSSNHRLSLSYELAHVDELENVYSYLAGWRHQAQAESIWKSEGKELRLSYRFEFNDREDIRIPRFTSYSPTRHTLRVRGVMPVNDRMKASLELGYRNSRYHDASEQLDGGFITRTDDRYRTIARLIYKITDNADLSAKYTWTDNDSNITDKRYSRNQLEMGLSYLW